MALAQCPLRAGKPVDPGCVAEVDGSAGAALDCEDAARTVEDHCLRRHLEPVRGQGYRVDIAPVPVAEEKTSFHRRSQTASLAESRSSRGDDRIVDGAGQDSR